MKKAKSMNWIARVSLVLIFSMIFSAFLSQGWYEPNQAEATITYQTPGAVVYSTLRGTSIAPAYPAGTAAGDLLVLIVGMKPDTANGGSLTPPAGWTAIATLTGAGGYGTTLGIDTGNTNIYTFYKVADGTETGSLTVTIGDNNVSWAQIFRYSKTLEYWDVAGATGQDITTGTAVSIGFGSNPGVTSGDFILGAMCVPTDASTWSAEAFTQTGATFAAATEITEAASSTGNDVGGFIARTTVSSGTGTANPTMTATASVGTNAMGPGVFIRVREASTPPVTSGLIFVSPIYSTFVGSPFTFRGDLTDNESTITSCQYCVSNAECTSANTWVAGTLSGSGPTWTCTASNVTTYSNGGAIASGNGVFIDVRGTSTGGQNANGGTAVSKTMDKTAPTDGNLTITPGTDQNALSWTAASDGTGSGVGGYQVRYLQGATPPANCSSGALLSTVTGTTYTHSNLIPYVGGYSYIVCAVDNVSNSSTGKTGTGLPTWSATTTSCGRCHAYPPLDGTARNSPPGAVVGSHQTHNYICAMCHVAPATETSADYGHRNGKIEMQPGAAAISNGYYDKNNNSAYNAGVDDAFAQSNAATTSVCRNVACHGGNVTPQWGIGSVGCKDCHKGPINLVYNTRQITETATGDGTGDFVKLSRHVSNGTATEIVTNYDCTVCHAEGNAQTALVSPKYVDDAMHMTGTTSITRMVKLRNVDNITQTYDWNKNAVTETMRSNMDTFCLNCHDSNGSSGIAVTGPYTSPALTLSPSTSEALSPFNDTDNLRNGRDGFTTRSRVTDVKSQFSPGTYVWNAGNTTMPTGFTGGNYDGNPSQHAVMGPRYYTNNSNWTAGAWVNHTLRSTQVMNNAAVREKAKLHCSDCHLVETNAHGAANAWHMLLNGTANDYATDFGMGASTSATAIVCYKCHDSTVYSSSGTTPSRFNHNEDGNTWGQPYGGADSAKLGPPCLNCHGGDNFGNIHGVSGTYTPGASFPPSGATYTRYRFLPGAWMQYKPGSGGTDADFNATTTATCYFPSSSTFSNCSHHAGGTASPAAPNYARPVKY